MKTHLIKLAIIAVEVLGVVVAVALAGSGYLFWRLERDALDVSALCAPVAQMIDRQLPDGHVSAIEAIRLVKDREDNAYHVVLDGVRVRDESGRDVAALVQTQLTFASRDFLAARFYPRRLLIDQPTIDLIRAADNRLRIETDAPRPRPQKKRRRKAANKNGGDQAKAERSPFIDALDHISLANATLSFRDEASGRSWRSQRAQAIVKRAPGGFVGDVEAVFDVEGETAMLNLQADYDEASEILTAAMHLENARIADLLNVFYGAGEGLMDARLSGAAQVKIARNGRILSSSLKGRAEDGQVKIGKSRARLYALEADAHFNAGDNSFEIRKLMIDADRLKGAFSGVAQIELGADLRSPAEITFDIKSAETMIGRNNLFAAPVNVDDMRLAGAFQPFKRTLSLNAIEVGLGDNRISGDLRINTPSGDNGRNARSPGVFGAFEISGDLEKDTVLALWPEKAAARARDYVSTQITKGHAQNFMAQINLPVGAIDANGRLPDEALQITFDIAAADVAFVRGMTALKGASGSARLGGNSFFLEGVRGRVKDIDVAQGSIEFPAFYPIDTTNYYRFEATGPARSIMSVLDEKPLNVLKTTRFSADDFSGKARLKMTVRRENVGPRKIRRTGFEGAADFENLSVRNVVGDIPVRKADGRIVIDTDGMRVTGAAALGEAPIEIEWRQRFSGAGDTTRLKVTGSANSTTGDMFGIATRQFVRGDVGFTAEARGSLSALNKVRLETDFTDAHLIVSPFGWLKPAGASATGVLDLTIDAAKIDVTEMTVSGEGVDINGGFSLLRSGRIESARFDRFYLDEAADVSIKAERTPAGALSIFIAGAQLHLGPLVEALLSGVPQNSNQSSPDLREIGWGAGVKLQSRLDRLELRNGVQYTDADLDFWRDEAGVQALTLLARSASGAPLTMRMKMTGADEGPARAVEARSDDVGALLSGLFSLRSVRGGRGVIDLFIHDEDENTADETAPARISGVLEARDIKIVGAPILARIFAAGSLNGLGDLLSGDGIDFSQVFADFDFRDGVVELRDVRAAGSAIGLSAQGQIASDADGGVQLNGAIAPAYQVNSFLGKAPLIGDLFVNRDGEGFVALSYAVSGAPSNPTISVNPLSALAPGFLRRIFEPAARAAPGAPAVPAADAPVSDGPVSDDNEQGAVAP